MEIQKILLKKNGIVTISLAKEFLRLSIGDKIPTVSELCDNLGLARGTIQNSIKLLTSKEAIKLEARGHLGTYLIDKNMFMLLSFAGISSIVGAMPLPYSKKYEGLASGLIGAMENKYNIPVTLGYMRGAKNRISMVLSGRYDFAITSKYAAEEYMREYKDIDIAMSFGPRSYLSDHIVIFHDPQVDRIKDNMKIGVDYDSIDHRSLTEIVCKDKKVNYVPVEYSRIIERVMSGDIDAAVWNMDEIVDKIIKINYKRLGLKNLDDTEAVMVVAKRTPEISCILNELINIEAVLNIQRLVEENKITPSY